MRSRFRSSVRMCSSMLVAALSVLAAASANAQNFIDLADVVAGGDGHGTGGGANGEREFSAIDIDESKQADAATAPAKPACNRFSTTRRRLCS